MKIRKLEAAVMLSKQTFRGENTKIIKDLAMEATVEKLGFPDSNKLALTVYGMAQEDIEPLTMLAFDTTDAALNKIVLTAGDEEEGKRIVFVGDIIPGGAIADYSGSPEIKMIFNAMTGYQKAVTPTSPTSVKGLISFTELITMVFGKKPILAGKDKQIENPYLSGSVLKQVKDLCASAGYELIIDDDEIYINTKDEYIKAPVPLINKESGLIGYPKFSQAGVDFKCVYNPALRFAGVVKLESVIPRASGEWQIIGLTHHITAMIPGGAWESDVKTCWI
jgi:hypothetical protein